MSDNLKIEWTDATWKPMRGGSKISPGGFHGYAETFAEPFPIPTEWTHSLPLVRPSRAFGFAKFLSPFPQTAQVQPSALGWPVGGTTLGNVIHYFFQPQRGCSNGATECYNPVGVENIWEQLPRVVAALQPW